MLKLKYILNKVYYIQIVYLSLHYQIIQSQFKSNQNEKFKSKRNNKIIFRLLI